MVDILRIQKIWHIGQSALFTKVKDKHIIFTLIFHIAFSFTGYFEFDRSLHEKHIKGPSTTHVYYIFQLYSQDIPLVMIK